MQNKECGFRGRPYKFFRWLVSYTTFQIHFKDLFDIRMDGRFTLDELNNMIVYEFEIYKYMLEQKIKQEILEENKKKSQRLK